MAADEINFLRQTLVDLDYREDFDSGSVPLLKHLIGDMKGLSEHCNDVEQENHELRHRLESLLSGEIGESSVIISKMPANANDTYLIEVAESAKTKIEKLTSELEQLRRATADKKGPGASALHNASIKEHQDELAAIKESLGKLIGNLRGLSPSLAKDLDYLSDISNPRQIAEISKDIVLNWLKSGSSPADRSGRAEIETISAEKLRLQAQSQDLEAQVSLLKVENEDLNDRLNSTSTLGTNEIMTQIGALEKANSSLQSKLRSLEQVYQQIWSGDGSNAREQAMNLMEMLSVEISTEAHFTSHLVRLTEKLNKRVAEQDDAMVKLRTELKESIQELHGMTKRASTLKFEADKSLVEKKALQSNVEQLQSILATMKSCKEADDAKIASQAKKLADMKALLESSKSVAGNLRQQEEILRKHIEDQDSRINQFRGSLNGSASEIRSLSSTSLSLQSEIAAIKLEKEEKIQEIARLSAELEQERAKVTTMQNSLQSFEKKTVELEGSMGSRRKEKDLMMNTHFKLIKANEKLCTELATCKQDLARLQARENSESARMVKSAQEVDLANSKARAYEEKIRALSEHAKKLERDLANGAKDAADMKKKNEELQGEMATLKQNVSRLEKIKMDNYNQLTQLTRRIADTGAPELDILPHRLGQGADMAPHHFMQKPDTAPHRFGQGADMVPHHFMQKPDTVPHRFVQKPEMPPHYMAAPPLNPNDYTLELPQPSFFSDTTDPSTITKMPITGTEAASRNARGHDLSIVSDESDNKMARGILNDWLRRNADLKSQLKEFQQELKNDLSFAVNSVDSPAPQPIDVHLNQTMDPTRRLEAENKVLIDIMDQVRSDLQKAALISPVDSRRK